MPDAVPSPRPGSSAITPVELSARLKASLGDEQYSQTRAILLSHQEMFMGQLFDLHRIAQLQRHLICVCSDKAALSIELAKLEAEQLQRDQAELQLEQDGSNEVTLGAALRPATEMQAERTVGASRGPAATPGQQQSLLQPPYVGGRPAIWPAPYARGAHPSTFAMQQQLGRPMLGSTGSGGGPPFLSSNGLNYGMDPMMAWYMLHCGQYAQAVHSAAHALMQAQEDRQVGGNRALEEGTKLRWWHDAEKVFGAAANPDVIAGFVPNEQSPPKLDPRIAIASKLPSLPGTHTAHEGTGDTVGGSSAEDAPSKRQQQEGSLGTEALASAGTGRKAGSGLSAFKKLPTKSSHMRPPPTRAESIGSEVSRSAADRSHIDEGESSGIAHASGKADGRSNRSGASEKQAASGGS